MSQAPQHDAHYNEADPAEEIVDVIPWIVPLAGAALIFLMAFIAVVMA